MSRKFIISEQERNNILKLHKLLNESVGDMVNFDNLEAGKYYVSKGYVVNIISTIVDDTAYKLYLYDLSNKKFITNGNTVKYYTFFKKDFHRYGTKFKEITKEDYDKLVAGSVLVKDFLPDEPTTTVNSLGCLEGGCQNGEGKLKSEEGYYIGNFENGKFEGKGTLSNISSEAADEIYISPLRPNFHDDQFTYEGNFINGFPEGNGKIDFDNGDKYEGEFYEGKIEGEGTMTFKNGSVYKGEFETIKVDDLTSTYKVKTIDKTIDDLVKYNSERPRVTDVYSNLTTGTRLKGMFKSGSVVGTVLGVEDKGLDSIVKIGLINTYEGKPLQSLSYIASRVPTLKTKMDLELKNPENTDRTQEIKSEYKDKIERAKKNIKKILPTVKLQNKNIKSIVYETKANENGFFEFENVEVGEYILTVDTKFIFSKSPKYEFRLKNEDDLEFTIIMSKKDFLSFLQKEGNVYNKKLINEAIGDVVDYDNLEAFKFYKNDDYLIGTANIFPLDCYLYSLKEKKYIGEESDGGIVKTFDTFGDFKKEIGEIFTEITKDEYINTINTPENTSTTYPQGAIVRYDNLDDDKYYKNENYIFKTIWNSIPRYQFYPFSIKDKKYVEKGRQSNSIPEFKKYGETFTEISEDEYKKTISDSLNSPTTTSPTTTTTTTTPTTTTTTTPTTTTTSTSPTTTTSLTKKECEDIVEKYYQTYISLYRKTTSIDDIDKNMLKKEKEKIKSCHARIFKKLSRKTKDYINQLDNVLPLYEFLELNLQIQENANIYKLNDKIKNIITEQKEMKSKMLVEKELINKRFDFVVESLIERDDVENKTFLLELQLEKRKLIKSGYDSLMVQDSFLDIVNTFL